MAGHLSCHRVPDRGRCGQPQSTGGCQECVPQISDRGDVPQAGGNHVPPGQRELSGYNLIYRSYICVIIQMFILTSVVGS